MLPVGGEIHRAAMLETMEPRQPLLGLPRPGRRDPVRAPSSCSTSTRSHSAAPAWRASTATWCSCRARIPGDRVRAVVGKSKRAYAEARAVEIVEAEPRADRAARRTIPARRGRCSRTSRQLEVKEAQVKDALQRIGKLDGYALEPIVPAVEEWRYRNKLEYSFGSEPGGRLVCGFHAPGRWDEIVDVTDCLLASERGQRRA